MRLSKQLRRQTTTQSTHFYTSLEARRLLAGDVTVFLDGSLLNVVGDAEDNMVQISQDATGSTVVTGIDTTINGLETPFVQSDSFSELTVELRAGDDELSVVDQSVEGNARFLGEGGNDFIEIDEFSSRYLHVEGNLGDDVVEFSNSEIEQSTYVFLGDGNDVLAAEAYSNGRNFKVFGEDGNDSFVAGEFSVARKFRLSLGDGNDNALFVSEGEVGRSTKIRSGSGDDFVGVLPSESDDAIQFSRRFSLRTGSGDDIAAIDSNVSFERSNRVVGGSGDDSIQLVDSPTSVRERGFETLEVPKLDDLVSSVFDTLASAGVPASFFNGEADASLQLVASQATLSLVENQAPTPVDDNIELTGELADVSIVGATVALSNFQTDQDLLSFTDEGDITGDFDEQTGVLTLSGLATASEYEAALQAVQYENTSESPIVDQRSIEFEITTSEQEIFSANRLFEIESVNDAPSLQLSVDSISSVPSVPTLLDEQLVVLDVDSANLSSAIVSVISGFESGADQLTFEPVSGILGTFDPSTGALTFAGEASIEEYQSLLQTVAFESTALDDADRTILFTVNDGSDSGSDELSLDLEI